MASWATWRAEGGAGNIFYKGDPGVVGEGLKREISRISISITASPRCHSPGDLQIPPVSNKQTHSPSSSPLSTPETASSTADAPEEQKNRPRVSLAVATLPLTSSSRARKIPYGVNYSSSVTATIRQK